MHDDKTTTNTRRNDGNDRTDDFFELISHNIHRL